MNRGIITLAFGKRYREMAKTLFRSIRRFNPQDNLAVITDDSSDFNEFDNTSVIDFEPHLGKGLEQKLFLDHYSPFEHTLYIDADCVVYGSLNRVWQSCGAISFAAIGEIIDDPRKWWYYSNTSIELLSGISSLPKFNGGIYVFKKDLRTANIFTEARALLERYHEDEIGIFRDGISDEPLIALAMARHGVQPVEGVGFYLATPVDFGSCPVRADVFAGTMTYEKNGEERPVIVAHFFGSWTACYLYLLESFRLRYGNGMLKWLLPPMAKVIGDAVYGSFLMIRKLLLKILRPSANSLPNGLLVIPLLCFTQRIRSVLGMK